MAHEAAIRIGRRIREAREAKGWTQRELADNLPGLTNSDQISKYERGLHRPSDNTLCQIGAVTDRDYAWFVTDESAREETPDLLDDLARDGSQLSQIVEMLAGLDKRMAQLEAKLDGISEDALDSDGAKRAIQQAFEDYAERLGQRIGKRPPRSRRSPDHPGEAPEAAA